MNRDVLERLVLLEDGSRERAGRPELETLGAGVARGFLEQAVAQPMAGDVLIDLGVLDDQAVRLEHVAHLRERPAIFVEVKAAALGVVVVQDVHAETLITEPDMKKLVLSFALAAAAPLSAHAGGLIDTNPIEKAGRDAQKQVKKDVDDGVDRHHVTVGPDDKKAGKKAPKKKSKAPPASSK